MIYYTICTVLVVQVIFTPGAFRGEGVNYDDIIEPTIETIWCERCCDITEDAATGEIVSEDCRMLGPSACGSS